MWPVAQRSPAAQRRGRYVAGSSAHPARMLPDLAAHAIRTYTRPGERVFDPMCGIGTTLVGAVHAGRRAVGVEYETGWAALAEANIAHARGSAAASGSKRAAGPVTVPSLASSPSPGPERWQLSEEDEAYLVRSCELSGVPRVLEDPVVVAQVVRLLRADLTLQRASIVRTTE